MRHRGSQLELLLIYLAIQDVFNCCQPQLISSSQVPLVRFQIQAELLGSDRWIPDAGPIVSYNISYAANSDECNDL